MQHLRSIRAVATMSALGLALGITALVPSAKASPTEEILREALADPLSAASTALDPGIVAHLPENLRFTLSPELAAAYGVEELDADSAADLLAERGAAPAVVGAVETPEVGTVRRWPALDFAGDSGDPLIGLYLKEYTLTSKGPNIEVWVASGVDRISSGTQFMNGDCRAVAYDPTVVTKAQADGLVAEFEKTMLPSAKEVFSTPPVRNGTASLGQLELLGIDFRGTGTSTVTLVDNVRDPNFYDFRNNRSYVAGFFAPLFNVLTDRNVMTIDAFDWTHRTGLNPPNEPSSDICNSRPARPLMYESVFSHEYQHLLHSYQDAAETTWLNEGLSDMAPFMAGYSDPRRTVRQTRADSHIYCFQGFGNIKGPANPNPNECGGPENSLTLWGDQGNNAEILADYGNAWSFLLYLYDRWGTEFISALHQDGELAGLASVQSALDRFAGGRDVMDVMQDFQLSTLLDRMASAPGTKFTGTTRGIVTTKSLNAAANLRNKASHAKPGAAPNGADYVQLRNGSTFLTGSQLRSLSFSGAKILPTEGDGGPFGTQGPDIEPWTVRLVGMDAKGKRVLVRTFDETYGFSLGAAALKAFAGYPQVVAVVSHNDSRELLQTYAPYTLTVNGTVQPGG